MPALSCAKCNYDLSGLRASDGLIQCPECGERTPDTFRLHQLPLKAWLLCLTIGACAVPVVIVINLAMASRYSPEETILFSALFLFVFGPAAAAYFALRAAFAAGLPLSGGKWTSRAWVCALLTALDTCCLNLALAAALIVLAAFISMIR